MTANGDRGRISRYAHVITGKGSSDRDRIESGVGLWDSHFGGCEKGDLVSARIRNPPPPPVVLSKGRLLYSYNNFQKQIT
jgi:hypothetical protein